MLGLVVVLMLGADPSPTGEGARSAGEGVTESPAVPTERPTEPAPTLDAANRAKLQHDYTRLETERPSLRLPWIITGFGLLFVAFGAELVGGAWGWSRINPSGAWNQATTRYLTASGTGYLLGGLTISLTGAYLVFKAFRERRSYDVQLSEIQALLGAP
ncbi:MAG: hypothetical protein QM723_33925 [Myxococcaceae bacterium]